jgi:divalent metal cation (Fe/Co/Zn/Cd) transporter
MKSCLGTDASGQPDDDQPGAVRRHGLDLERPSRFTSLAVVIGAIGVMAGFPLADPIVGLLITVAILAVLRGAARDIYRRLMDAVDPDLVDAAEAAVRDVPGVRSVDSVQLRWIGHRCAPRSP